MRMEGEDHPEEIARAYAEEVSAPWLSSAVFLEEAMPIVTDLEVCNARLREAGRDDLVMTRKAEIPFMPSLDSASGEYNNFPSKFRFLTRINRGADDTPVTEEDLRKIREGIPNEKLLRQESSHIHKPAFHRMLVLFPAFTIPFVLAISQPGRRSAKFDPDLFVAYRLMSHLVDPQDNRYPKDEATQRNYLIQ